jgi:hypothetical protein
VAYSVKASEVDGEVRADKIVIVTGPTFGTAVKFMLLGAALGAAAAISWKNGQSPALAPASPTLDDSEELTSRLNRLAARAKSIANRARNIAHNAAEVAGPALQQAIAEGRSAAREAEKQIKAQVEELKKDEPGPEQV